MRKMWWYEEPIIVGSLRWAVIDNDLKNNIRWVLKQLTANTCIEEDEVICQRDVNESVNTLTAIGNE